MQRNRTKRKNIKTSREIKSKNIKLEENNRNGR
jgi:hypothetical protein